MRRFAPFVVLAGLGWASSARAETTSWVSLGGGIGHLETPGRVNAVSAQIPIDAGVGLPPSMPVVVGLGVKFLPHIGEGLDYGAYVRAATQRYVLGGFGLALDAGAYRRTFADESSGFLGVLNVGLPWGFVASGNYGRAADGVQTLGVSLGLDFLRLTVYRLAGEQQWYNVRPAWRP